MSRGLEVAFTGGRVFFPAGHLSRIGGTFDGMLAASAIRDADPAATPPEIRILSGEILFVSAGQQEELERFCRASQIPSAGALIYGATCLSLSLTPSSRPSTTQPR